MLITTVILQLLTQYALNFWNRDFFDAIGRRDREELWTQALRFVPLAAASLTLMILQVRARMTTQITWREWLSNHLYDYWLKDNHYVRLRFAASDHQTPESASPRNLPDRSSLTRVIEENKRTEAELRSIGT